MDQAAATEIATRELKRIEAAMALELAFVRVIERPRGWVFTYTSVEFLKTRRDSARLVGNSPIYVRDDGEIFDVPTAPPPMERRVEELEATFPGLTSYGPER